MSDLRMLAERAEAGVGADRELDARVWAELDGRDVRTDGDAFLAKSRTAPFDECLLGIGAADQFLTAGQNPPIPRYTVSLDAAKALFPWTPHPCATLTTRIIQSGVGSFLCWVEFTWPSTEIQGRARDEARATLACALRAIQRTNEELAPYQRTERKKT